MSIPLILLFTLLSLVIDVISTAVLTLVYRRLMAAGKSPVLPLSLDPGKLRISALTEKRGFIALFASMALFWPFLEETVFRLAPYIAAGLVGALLGTVAWTLSHYTKLYVENSHLDSRSFAALAAAYLGCIGSSGFIYAVGMHATGALWLPYLLHVFHNSWVLVSMRSIAASTPKNTYVKARAPTTVKTKPKTVQKPMKWVGGIRWEYLE